MKKSKKNLLLPAYYLLLATYLLLPTIYHLCAASPTEFLQITPAARSAAMADAGAALSDTVNAIYANPAILGTLKSLQLSVSHSFWILDFNLDYAAFVYPTKNKGSFGAYFTTLWMAEKLQGFDSDGNKTGDVDFGNTVFCLSYGSPNLLGVDNKVYVGTTVKYFSATLGPESAGALLLDIGLFSDNFWGNNWNIGAVMQNLPLLKPSFGDVAEKVDVNLKLGINYELLILKTEKILLGLLPEIDFNTLYKRFNIGTEFIYRLIPQKLEGAIRLGYKTNTDLAMFASLSFGAGIKYRNYALDYGFNSYEDMGYTHRISLIFSF